ncbi:hypothetical protein K503DRAFT_767834 [Rhizopogon vinicolor AM-OR11-026]|uniref:Uncharacterized protein n=1 Tax=Rhizopogon vinicolor AM-OR11-026 TaxID=1314800 RepID=A0A1B7N8X4_9AGAM|nr:hypothetical protein K503DRAFT_767834 [Rhizopogon vinicolor AM-OR11-026]
MSTAQATSTDVQSPQTSSQSATLHDVVSNAAPQSSIHRVSPSHSRSRPSTTTSNFIQTTGQPAPTGQGAPSSSIHHGANLILELIMAERKQAFEDTKRQITFLQQQYNEHRTTYLRELTSASTKRRDAENMVSHLSNERDRYLKEAVDVQNALLQARADAIAARREASEAVKASDDARSHLMAVQDTLQQVGIAVNQGDTEAPNTLKIILGTPWLELLIPDKSAPDTPGSHAPLTQLFTSPSDFISFFREHINRLTEALYMTQNGCKTFDSQRNQLQSDICTMDLHRTELESLKRELEENLKNINERGSRVTELENEVHSLKKEREDAVRAKEEAVAALEEMRRTMEESVNTLKSNLDKCLQDQQCQAEANAEKDRQGLESSIETKTGQIHDLHCQLAQSMATLDEWKAKYDVVVNERDSQQQLHVAELQKSHEAISVRTESQIDDLQKRLAGSSCKALASEDILKAKESRIEELEKELTLLRKQHIKSSQGKDEAVALVESRDAQIKVLPHILAVSSSRNVTTESAPKTNSDGSLVEDKARAGNSSTPPDQLQFGTQDIPKASPVVVLTDPQSRQIPAPKKVEKQKSKSSPFLRFPITRPLEIDSASSTDVEIIAGPLLATSQGSIASSDEIEIVSGPSPFAPQGTAVAKHKLLLAMSNKAASQASSAKIGDSAIPWKTSLKRSADVNDPFSQATKRPKLSINASASLLKDKVSSTTSNSPAPTSLGSRSTTSSPAIAEPGISLDFRRRPPQMSNPPSSSGGKSSKKSLAHSPNLRTPQSATSGEALSAGANASMEGDVRGGSGSVASKIQNGPQQQLAAKTVKTKPRARLRHGQGKAAAPTAGEATGPKKQAEFRNFNPSTVPAKEQPSGSLVRPTAEQQQGASSATAPTSTEAQSSSSWKGTPSLLDQLSGKDNLSTPPSDTLPPSTKPLSPLSTRTADPSRDSTPKSISPAAGGSAQSSTPRPIPKGPRSSIAVLQANQESSPKGPWGPKSMLSVRSSGKVPQKALSPAIGTTSAGRPKKGTA